MEGSGVGADWSERWRCHQEARAWSHTGGTGRLQASSRLGAVGQRREEEGTSGEQGEQQSEEGVKGLGRVWWRGPALGRGPGGRLGRPVLCRHWGATEGSRAQSNSRGKI